MIIHTPGFRLPGKICILLMMAVHLFSITQTHAAFYAFGDSAIDNGNVFVVSGGTTPASPYWQGRFSNNVNYLDHMTAAVPGWDASAWALGGQNYAFGAAESGTGSVLGGIPNVGQQIIDYSLIAPGPFSRNDMILLSMGQNDLLSNKGAPPPAAGIAATLIQNLQRVYDLGGRQIIFPSVFPMHLMPEVVSSPLITQAEAKQWVDDLNTAVESQLAQFQTSNPDALIVRTDLTARISDVYSNPSKYGLTNVTQGAYSGDYTGAGGTVTANPGSYLWWDGAHVTTQVQKLIAQWILSDTQDLVYPGQAAPQAGFAAIHSTLDHIRMTRQFNTRMLFQGPEFHGAAPSYRTLGFRPQKTSPPKRPVQFYLSPVATFGNQDPKDISDGYHWQYTGILLGGIFRLTPELASGLAVNYSQGKVEMDHNTGRTDSRLLAVDAHFGFKSRAAQFSGGMGYGKGDNEAQRNMTLTQTIAQSDFDSDMGFAWAEAGYAVPITSSLELIPLLGMDYAHINHKAHNETQGGLLAYEALDYLQSDHLRHKLGARISGKLDPGTVEWQWEMSAAWHHEYLDSQIWADATLAGVTRRFSSPARPRDSMTLSISQKLSFVQNFSIMLGYEGEYTKESQAHLLDFTMAWTF